MMIKLLPLLLIIFFSACASRVVVDPKGCDGQGVWLAHDDKAFDHERHYDQFSLSDLKEKFDFVITKNVKTSWGILKEERIYTKALLEQNGIRCHEVQGLSVTFHNQPWDVALSFVPLLGRKTVYLYGNFWEKRAFVMEDEEPGQ